VNPTALIWFLGCAILYAITVWYSWQRCRRRRTQSELLMGAAGFLLMFMGWSLYFPGITWVRMITSTWIGLSSGLGFGWVVDRVGNHDVSTL
jgi:hypothetical protein